MSGTEISNTQFARLESELGHVRGAVDRLENTLAPLALARSGDLAVIASIQRDINSSHEKLRITDRRLDALEKRTDRLQWTMLAAWAIIQFIWSFLGPRVIAALGGG